jgi:hypothetical protein
VEALLQYDQVDWPYIRFVYLPHYADPEWPGVMNVAINSAASHSARLVPARVFEGGYLLGVNLADLAPEPVQRAKLISTWDSLAVKDSVFHVPAMNLDEKYGGRVALLAPHLGVAIAQHATDREKDERLDVIVAQLTQSTGAIYPYEFLLEQLMDSKRGEYLSFRQIKLSTEGITPLQQLCKNRGFFLEQSIDGLGEKADLILISQVTGKGRVALAVYGVLGRTPMFITYDFKDSNVRPENQQVRNLINFVQDADGHEVFVPMENGLIEFVIANADGNILRAVPPDIAIDSTIPDGHTKELTTSSCISCHYRHDMYQPSTDDLDHLLVSNTNFLGDDPFRKNRKGDIIKLSKHEALEIVISRFAEPLDDPDGVMGRARRDYLRAVSRLTDYNVGEGQPSAVVRFGEKYTEILHRYRYASIDATRALEELSVTVPAGRQREVIRMLVPAPPLGAVDDVVIGMLREGAVIKREDMEAIRGDLALRALGNYAAILELNKEDQDDASDDDPFR